jgi:hypothetical protein
MTIKDLEKYIASFEGKKHQASIGDIREIIGILSDLIYEENTPLGENHEPIDFVLYLNGEKRAQNKSRKRQAASMPKYLSEETLKPNVAKKKH